MYLEFTVVYHIVLLFLKFGMFSSCTVCTSVKDSISGGQTYGEPLDYPVYELTRKYICIIVTTSTNIKVNDHCQMSSILHSTITLQDVKLTH